MAASATPAGARNRELLVWLLIAASVVVFVLLFFALYPGLGIWTTTLFVIPLTALALKCGLRGALIAGLLAFPFNWGLNVIAQGGIGPVVPLHFLRWGVAILAATSVGLVHDRNIRYRRLNAELRETNARLEAALAEVKAPSGLVPICAGCGKLRSDGGYWLRVEDYMRARSGLEFSHGLCPDCFKRLYPDIPGEPPAGGAPPR